jgi:hypothetical protein
VVICALSRNTPKIILKESERYNSTETEREEGCQTLFGRREVDR